MKAILVILALSLTLGAYAGIQVQSIFTNITAQFSPQPAASFNTGNPPKGSVISVDDLTQYQEIQGFGAALTDSSASLIYDLNGDDYWNLINSLFNPQSGIGISYIRLPISACDFSLTNYTYDNKAEGQTDPDLQSFSIDHDQAYIIPVIKTILQVNPFIKIVMSPWSPPAWMKNSFTLVGTDSEGQENYLLHQFYHTYANYFVKAIKAYEKEGITIDALTIQNEPLYGPTGYPGMVMNATNQTDFINNYLAQAFITNNIETKVFVYDHNWDMEEYPSYVYGNLTSQSQQIVGGAAFHCYNGDVSNQTVFHNKYPNAHIYLTECSGGGWSPDWTGVLVWDLQNLFIGAVNNWAEVSIKWNLALNQNDGPTNNGCLNCRGLVTIDTDNNQITYNVDYYTVGTFSKYVRPGATRINVESDDSNLMATGFNNPDGSRVVIVLNQDASASHSFSLTWNDSWIQSTIPAETVTVYTWIP